MKRAIPVLMNLLLCAGVAVADDLKDASDKVPQLAERLTKLKGAKAGEYAKTELEAAQTSIGAVKAALAAKNGAQALQKSELADLQLIMAEAKAAEQESAEQLVLRRTELRTLEAQFDQLLQTGGK